MKAEKAGFVALLGATNSGKSTFLNAALGTKVSITSHKVQTTRSRILGIKNIGRTQVVFVDTPGIFTASGRFDRAMVGAALRAMDESDAVVLILDAAKGATGTFDSIAARLGTISAPVALALNKVDLVDKRSLLGLVRNITERAPGLFEEVFMISALKNDGVDGVVGWAASKMPSAKWYFEDGRISGMPLSFQLAEITREQVYAYLHQELPYAIAVKTDSIKEGAGLSVAQTVYASQEGHKPIIIGARGAKLKAIGTKARLEMERLLKRKVNLFLDVKLRKDWHEAPEFFKDIGLEYKG
ncbi:MAG: GTPase Era [Rickettsiales bacterium]|jgi:GTP-binding protein Era|nr:GTPase Era [Rickettsiales bacterium]